MAEITVKFDAEAFRLVHKYFHWELQMLNDTEWRNPILESAMRSINDASDAHFEGLLK